MNLEQMNLHCCMCGKDQPESLQEAIDLEFEARENNHPICGIVCLACQIELESEQI